MKKRGFTSKLAVATATAALAFGAVACEVDDDGTGGTGDPMLDDTGTMDDGTGTMDDGTGTMDDGTMDDGTMDDGTMDDDADM